MKVREMKEQDFDSIMDIVEKLKTVDEKTGWFQEDARKRAIPIDLRIQKGLVAEDDDRILGFVTYFSKYGHPKIGWLGVVPSHRGEGIGTKLIERLEEKLKNRGAKDLRVETPAKHTVQGTSYERTYEFYEKMGFQMDKIEKFEQTGGDMAILKKSLE